LVFDGRDEIKDRVDQFVADRIEIADGAVNEECLGSIADLVADLFPREIAYIGLVGDCAEL